MASHRPLPSRQAKAHPESKPIHPSALPSERITPAREGDRIPVQALLRDQHQGAFVKARCDADAGAFICLPCAQYLANQYQLELHTETGAHAIARVCSQHGAEEL